MLVSSVSFRSGQNWEILTCPLLALFLQPGYLNLSPSISSPNDAGGGEVVSDNLKTKYPRAPTEIIL